MKLKNACLDIPMFILSNLAMTKHSPIAQSFNQDSYLPMILESLSESQLVNGLFQTYRLIVQVIKLIFTKDELKSVFTNITEGTMLNSDEQSKMRTLIH